MKIVEDDLTSDAIAHFLREHFEEMHAISPRDSAHVLDIQALRAPGVTFWSGWVDGDLAGCGALKEHDVSQGEIKSMRTAQGHRGKGVASRLVAHLIEQARLRGYRHLFLETGSQADFEPARQLYLRSGFEFCGPFADYVEDSNSVFMTKEL